MGMLPWSAFDAGGFDPSRIRRCTDRLVYSLGRGRYTLLSNAQKCRLREALSGGDHGSRAAESHCAVRHGVPRPSSQAALLRPGVLPARDRAAVVPYLADG